jgi:ankyrin repeat protein
MAKKQSKAKKSSKNRVSRRNKQKIQKGGNQELIDMISNRDNTQEDIIQEVQALLNNNSIELEKQDKNGRTPLYIASTRGFAKVVRLLVDAGANVNGNDLLHTVSYFGHKDVLEVLLSVDGINVNAKQRDGSTPLHYALTYGHLGAVEALLEHPTIDVNGDSKDTLVPVAEKRLPPLHEALYHNNWDIAKALINHPKIDLEVIGMHNSTPLGIASMKGKLDVVIALLEKGAVVDNLSSRDTPLYIAAENGRTDVVRVLLERGADHNFVSSLDNTPLYIASKKGHTDVVHVLLEADQSKDYVNKPDNSRKTPLHVASYNGHTDVVTELVCAGAQVNLADMVDNTPLFYASYLGHIDVVKKLLSHPDIRVSSGIGTDGKATKRRDGKTAVSVAAAKNHFDIVELLMPKLLLERPDYGKIQAQNDRVEEQWQKAVERRGVAEVVVKGRSHSPRYIASDTEIFVDEGKALPLGFGCRRRPDGTSMMGKIAEFIGGKRKTKKSNAKKGSNKRVSRRNKIQK